MSFELNLQIMITCISAVTSSVSSPSPFTPAAMGGCAVGLTAVLCSIVLLSDSLASVAVFQHGEGGYPCIRIPAIARCGGLLHAFAECRTRTGDGCVPTLPLTPETVAGVCYKNSSDDGASWSTLTLVVSGATQPTVVCEQQTRTLILQFNVSI